MRKKGESQNLDFIPASISILPLKYYIYIYMDAREEEELLEFCVFQAVLNIRHFQVFWAFPLCCPMKEGPLINLA